MTGSMREDDGAGMVPREAIRLVEPWKDSPRKWTRKDDEEEE